jgi:hypothetical protein
MLHYTMHTLTNSRAVFGRGEQRRKNCHKFQNFNGLGLMRFPFSFETGFDKVN